MFDKNSEANFVMNSVFEFIKAWDSGVNSKLYLKSRNGQAWLNFTCNLGGPQDQHQKMKPKKPKSKKKQERDNLRAKLHQQKLQESSSDLNTSMLASAYHHSDKVVDSDIVENEAAAANIPLTEETIRSNLSFYYPCDHNGAEAKLCQLGPKFTSLGISVENQDQYGFRAHLKKMLDQTIVKYALRKVEIQSIVMGEIIDRGISEHSELFHLLEYEISVSYKQDQIRRYEYDRRAVPLAIAFRKDYDSDIISGFLGLQRISRNCDPIIFEDLAVAYEDEFISELIQFKETRRRAIQI